MRPFANAWQDLRYASRTLSRSRGFVLVTTLIVGVWVVYNNAAHFIFQVN